MDTQFPNNNTQQRISAALRKAEAQHAWYGTWTLFRREIRRFINIAGQSIVSPVLSTLLYFLVFGYSLGSRIDTIHGVRYIDFIVPGLVMMSLITNSFFNSAFSFFLAKIHGTIVDLLASPIGATQILLAYCSAAVIRGTLTGGIIWLISALLGANTLFNPMITVLFMFGSSFVFGLLGLTTAILSREFEHINFVPSFVVLPLSFLGGVFYSTSMLPPVWATVSLFNPILYIINGIRYGMTGVTDVPIWQGFLFLGATGTGLLIYTIYLLKTGKKLRE
jgi:ABC-2 type transport system permease protein